MATIVSRIRKNANEEIWVTLDEYEGHNLLNIRAYFRSLEGFRPTTKGVAVNVSRLKELRDALAEFVKPDSDVAKVVIIPKNTTQEFRVYRNEYTDVPQG